MAAMHGRRAAVSGLQSADMVEAVGAPSKFWRITECFESKQ